MSLSALRNDDGHIRLFTISGEEIRFNPANADRVLELLTHTARGDNVTIVPARDMLTVTQAADFLNASETYLTHLLDSQILPFRTFGRHRYVKMVDLQAYRAERDRDRDDALDELARLGQAFDIT